MKQSIAIFKNDKTGKPENYPGYSLVVSELQPDGTFKKLYAGQLWSNPSAPENHPVLKGEMSGGYTKKDNTVVYGYKVVEDRPETTPPLPTVDPTDFGKAPQYEPTDRDIIDIKF